MQSTLSVFPSSKKVLDSTKIPFVLYAQPIPEDLSVINNNNNIQIPRCPNPNCTAFFNSLCSYSKRGWTCSVCGQHVNFNSTDNKNKSHKSPKKSDQNDQKHNESNNQNSFLSDHNLFSSITSTLSYQIIDPSVTFPLTHVIIIGCGKQEDDKRSNENDSFASSLLPASTIMQSLPPDAPVWVFVMNTAETARKLITTAGNFSQLSKLPKTSVRVPIKTTIPLLLSLLNAKKSCFWCRVFCAGGTIDSTTIDKLKQIDRIPIRIDFFIDSPITFSGSSSTSTLSVSHFANNVPGVIRFFYYASAQSTVNSSKRITNLAPIESTPTLPSKSKASNFPSSVSVPAINDKTNTNNSEFTHTFENMDVLNSAVDVAASDCARPFGFQCKVIVKCGKHYKASSDADKATLSVIASSRSAVPFVITPQILTNSGSSENLPSPNLNGSNISISPTASITINNGNNINGNLNNTSSSTSKQKLMFQAVQVLAHVHIWDPPTNTLRKCTNVINCDFPVSSNVQTLISSASPSALFDFWARHNKLHLVEKMKQEYDNMKPLIKMYQNLSASNSNSPNSSNSNIFSNSTNSSKKKNQIVSNNVFIPLGRFGNLNLCNKSEFDAFSAEFFALCPPTTWRFVLGTFIETWKGENSDDVIVIIVKKFPNVYFALKEGIDVLLGDAVRMYVELCKPLSINVQQCTFEQISAKFKDEIASSQSSA